MAKPHRTSTTGLSLLCIACGVSGALAQDGGVVALPDIVVAPTPVPGAVGIDGNKVPAAVSQVPAKDFIEQYSPSVTTAITSHVPGAIALSVDGSDLSPDLFFRGFDVSRISGTPIGLAVYQNGSRINETFGDAVNLDLIPPIAIDRADIYTNNPIFGLNALGGAINFTTKNGFTFHGGDATVLGGSFGRVNGFGEYGKQVGNYSFYVAADLFRDGGYRPFGAQNAERALADLGYRTQDAEVHLITNFGRSLLGVQGTTPQVLVGQQYNAVFTTPQTTNNQAGQVQLLGHVDLAPHWTLSGTFYFRQYDQFHVDGNDADVTDCSEIDGNNAGTLCQQPLNATTQTSNQLQFVTRNGPIASFGPGATDTVPYGTTANTSTHSTSFGTELQLTNTDKVFGHDNYFAFGGSLDAGQTNYSSTTTLGMLNASFQNVLSGVPGAGTILNTADQVGVNSTFVHSTATYYGVFALDTFNVTKQLAVTAGARLNIANINLFDVSGVDPELNSVNNFNRINPVFGATYTFAPALTVYGGYSEANRAPTPLESACSDQNRPCVLETALVSDPRLSQIVSHTFEAGGRGTVVVPTTLGTASLGALGGGVIGYKAGYFHTLSSNDIFSEPSQITGQGFFANVGDTLRQGVEAGFTYAKGPLTVYGNYAFIDATYRFNGTLSSPNNPNAAVQANGGIETIVPGNHIPGIPRNLGKLGFEYHVTPRFLVGADAVVVGSQYFTGDDSNLNQQLPAYYFINAHASYQVTDHVQVFTIFNNLTDHRYATFGTYYDTGTSAANVNATLANNIGGGRAGPSPSPSPSPSTAASRSCSDRARPFTAGRPADRPDPRTLPTGNRVPRTPPPVDDHPHAGDRGRRGALRLAQEDRVVGRPTPRSRRHRGRMPARRAGTRRNGRRRR